VNRTSIYYHMQKLLLFFVLVLLFLNSCGNKKVKQGSITYSIEYQLPDSLNRYKDYLPKTAVVYFKGDSTISVQQANDEATTVITYKPTDLMRVLLRSASAKYIIDYPKSEQTEILPARAGYSYTPTNEIKIIAGHKATKYNLIDKATGAASEAWFTREVSVVPSYLTTVFDTTYGVPLSFTTMQNDIPVTTTAKEIKFEPVPDGAFTAPQGYRQMTPKQFRELPVEN
jgi:outer membrane lipoprotein-sorting protein